MSIKILPKKLSKEIIFFLSIKMIFLGMIWFFCYSQPLSKPLIFKNIVHVFISSHT